KETVEVDGKKVDVEYPDAVFSRVNPKLSNTFAQNVAKEAQMIAEAGQLSAVTVATSMAGRGTDIKLSKEVHDIGGLAVIINEHMDNSRVDRQYFNQYLSRRRIRHIVGYVPQDIALFEHMTVMENIEF
ncbi:hypothetical protein, partial [Nocardiopsis sp. NPDC006832]|uniref:preprotein translocase subunit SecA n=1 Tax=Nocardiopsis sp. NPDC006832 TaxID=3157188 RepID=UPI0033F67780